MVGLFRTTACTTAVAEVEGGMHGGSGGWEWERDWGRSLCVRVKDEKEGVRDSHSLPLLGIHSTAMLPSTGIARPQYWPE
jgi:hypothetical protein